jgi:NAD(P)H-flavin reductase
MYNPYLPQIVKVISNKKVSNDTTLLSLQVKNFSFTYLQFVMVGLPGWGESALSIASAPSDKTRLAVAVRKVGLLTEKLQQLKVGDKVTLRGSFGNGLSEEIIGQDVLLIGGGCGFVPFRSIVLDYVRGKLKLKSLQTWYGCLNEQTLLFNNELKNWQTKAGLQVILEKPTRSWQGSRGLITKLFDFNKIYSGTKIIMVGPPIMYKFVIKKLLEQKVSEQNIYISLERKMYCGLGVCQHCAIGPYYVCKDGPVFRYDRIKNIPEVI